MRSLRWLSLYFWLANTAYFVMSVSALLMPLTQTVSGVGGRVVTALIGSLFWLSLLAGGAFVFLAERLRRTAAIKLQGRVSLPGAITFFDNPIAALCDTALLVSAAAFAVINLSDLKYQYVSYVYLFLLLFSLSMHCMFNGRIYKTIKQGLKGEKNDV